MPLTSIGLPNASLHSLCPSELWNTQSGVCLIATQRFGTLLKKIVSNIIETSTTELILPTSVVHILLI